MPLWVDFLKVVEDFWESLFLANNMNHPFIKLIPKGKKKGLQHISDLCPISQIGSVYKIISKVLSLRLKKVLCISISQEQGSFMGGLPDFRWSFCS